MLLTVLSIAYPFAPVSANAAGGAEQILNRLDYCIYLALYKSIAAGRRSARPLEVLYA